MIRSFPAHQAAQALAAAETARRFGGEVQWAGHDPAVLAAAQGLPLRVVSGCAGPGEEPRPPVPVDLPALPRAAVPSWPAGATPVEEVEGALAWLRASAGPWCVVWDRPWSPLAGEVAVALPGEGFRVVWRLPPGTNLPAAWLSRAATVPLKLIVDAADVPGPWPADWWVMASGDAAEVGAILAQHLRDEFPMLLRVGSPWAVTWPREQAWEPGQGRWLRQGPGVVRVCTADDAVAALAQPGPVWLATSLVPRAPVPTTAS